MLLGNVNITQEKKGEGDVGYGDNVDHGIYLLSMLRGRHGAPPVDAEKTTNGPVESPRKGAEALE